MCQVLTLLQCVLSFTSCASLTSRQREVIHMLWSALRHFCLIDSLVWFPHHVIENNPNAGVSKHCTQTHIHTPQPSWKTTAHTHTFSILFILFVDVGLYFVDTFQIFTAHAQIITGYFRFASAHFCTGNLLFFKCCLPTDWQFECTWNGDQTDEQRLDSWVFTTTNIDLHERSTAHRGKQL